MDSWLHQMRQRLVAGARPLLLNPNYDTVTKGMPLPSNVEVEAVDGGEDRDEEREMSRENGFAPQQDVERLNWGPEGEEAPLLASGKPFRKSARQRLIMLSGQPYDRPPARH